MQPTFKTSELSGGIKVDRINFHPTKESCRITLGLLWNDGTILESPIYMTPLDLKEMGAYMIQLAVTLQARKKADATI